MAAGPESAFMAWLEGLRREVHAAIRERRFSKKSREHCIARVKRCLDAAPAHVEQIWCDPDGFHRRCAMYEAIRHNAFDVYCLLLSRGCKFKNDEEKDKSFLPIDKNEHKEIQISEVQYQLARFVPQNEDAHVDYLQSRSYSVTHRDRFTEEVGDMFRELDQDELIRMVLKVAATSGAVRIFFDNDISDVECMTARRLNNADAKITVGLTDTLRYTIHIAGKRNREDVLGTLAHELCHLAVFLVYRNQCKPYQSDESGNKERYQRVFEEMRDRVNTTTGMEPLLTRVFRVVPQEQEQELIVQVPDILAKCRHLEYDSRMEADEDPQQERIGSAATEATLSHAGIAVLEEQAPSLLQYFKEVVVPDMENYLIKFRSEMDGNETRNKNESLGKANQTDDLGVTFKEIPCQELLEDVPLLVFASPNLKLLEVMIHNLVKATKLPYLFLEAQKWNQEVEHVLSHKKCDVVLISNPNNAVPEDICNQMASILSTCSEVRGTRVILLTANEQTDHVAAALRKQPFFSISMRPHEQLAANVVSKACFENVAEHCKRNVLSRSWINFQGFHERLSEWDEPDLNSLLSAMDEDTFMALCQSNELDVGPQLREDAEGYYVRRTCQKGSLYEETHLTEANEKIIIVTGAPGMGKTLLASRISKMIKEKGNRKWMLHVDLPELSRELKLLNSEDIFSDLGNFAEICGVKKAGTGLALFEKSITEGSPFKVVLILDAYDEMREGDREKILRVVHILAGTEVSKVFVFSRSVFKHELSDTLRTTPYELLPFTVQEQETFLKQYNERTTSDAVPPENPSGIRRLEDIWILLKDDETLLGTPFYLRMVAALENREVLDDIDSNVLRKACKSTGSEKYLGIYEMAIEWRYLQYRKEKKREDIGRACVSDDDVILKDHLYSSHQALAVKAVFDKKLCGYLLGEHEKERFQNETSPMNPLNKATKNRLKHGLLEGLRDGRPVFRPSSVAEFWAAERLFSKISSSASDKVHHLAFPIYGEDRFKTVTRFLDSFGMKSNGFHFAVMTRNAVYLRSSAGNEVRDTLERNPWHIAALHADEDTISVLSSTETRSLEEKDKLGVTPLDYAHQQHEWTKLHSICSQCSNTTLVANSELQLQITVSRELKDMEQWLLRERVRCPGNSADRALFFYIKSVAELERRTSSDTVRFVDHTCMVPTNKIDDEQISELLDEVRRRATHSNNDHGGRDALTTIDSLVDDTDEIIRAHDAVNCRCWAVIMVLQSDFETTGALAYQEQQEMPFTHMWFGPSRGCRESEESPSVQKGHQSKRSESSSSKDEQYSDKWRETPRVLEGPDPKNSETSSTNDEESSDKWRDQRISMHKAIDERNVDGVKKCLQIAPHLKRWLHPSTKETALHCAVKKQRMSICRLLRNHGCGTEPGETSDCSRETANVEAFMRRFHDENTTQTLKSHTESVPETADNERRTGDFYHALQANDLLKPMLSVSATSQRVKVTLNYDKESIDTVAGALENPKRGFANLETETICVAAKREKPEVLGTLAHEICHLALHFVYRNGGKPYLQTDRERALLYDTILCNIRKNQDKTAWLLRDVPREHDKEELIAYVPDLLAQYGSPGGENILEKQAPELFDFFKNVVIPDMIAYTKNRFPTRDQARIEVENRRLKHADETEDRQVKLKRDLDYRDLPDAPVLILTAPNLTVLEIMAYKAIKSTEQTHLFLRSSQWNPRLQDVLFSNCCMWVLLTCDQDAGAQFQNMLELFIELNEAAGTKVIVLAQEDNVKNLVQRLEKHPFLANGHKVMNVSDAHLDMVTEDTKRSILRTSRICFQGSPKLLPLEDLLDLTREDGIPDEVTCLMSCQLKTIEVGQPVPQLDQHVSEHYVERECERCVAIDVLKLRPGPDEAFVLWGDEIFRFLDRMSPSQQICSFTRVQQFKSFVHVECIDEYKAIVEKKEYKDKVVHLLQYDAASRSFRLVETNGPSSHLPMTGKKTCTEMDPVNQEKVVVICGHPGMGKSSLALRLCNMIKQRGERHLVLYVDLSKMNRFLRSLEKDDEPGQIKRLAALCGMKDDGLEFMLFQRSIKTGGPFKVTAVFDAFDEVEAGSRKNALSLIKFLTRTEVWKVFVFSRSVFKTTIQDTLGAIPFQLSPLATAGKVKLVRNYRKRPLVAARVEGCPEPNMLWRLLMLPDVSGNPCMFRMTMGVMEDERSRDFLIPLDMRTTCNENLATLFRKLAEHMYMIYKKAKRNDDVLLSACQDDYDVLGKQFYHDHELLAAKATLGDELSKQVLTDEERKELETRVMKLVAENRLRQGFIDGEINGHPVFVNNIFEAYFTARLLSRKVSTKRSPNTTRIVRDMYSGATYGRCIVHLGCLEEAISMSVKALKDFSAMCSTLSSTFACVEKQTSKGVASKVSQGMKEQRNYEQYLDILCYLSEAIIKHLESLIRYNVRSVGADKVVSMSPTEVEHDRGSYQKDKKDEILSRHSTSVLEAVEAIHHSLEACMRMFKSLTKVELDHCSYQQSTPQNELAVILLESAILQCFYVVTTLIVEHSKYDTKQKDLNLKFLNRIPEALKLGDYDCIIREFRAFVHSATTILGHRRDTYSKLSSTGDEFDLERGSIVDKFSQVLTFFDSSGAACCSIHTAIINGDSVDINEGSMNMLDEHGRTPLHVAALYANPEILKKLPLTDKLPGEDLLGMTPLMYADITCVWRCLDILCERYKDDSIKWDDQIPTVCRNIRTENRLDKSVLCECIEEELHHLLNIILSQFCSLVYHGGEKDKTPERVRVDSKRGDRGETPLFRAKSLTVFLLLLPYSNLQAVDSRKRTLLHQCAMEGRVDIAERVLIRFATSGDETWRDTPLGLAVRYWQNDVVKLLIPHFPADVEAICMRLHEWKDSATRLYERHLSILKLLHPHSSRLFQLGVPYTITMCNDCDTILYLLPYLNVHATVFYQYGHYQLFEQSERYYRKRRGMETLRMIKVIKLFLLHSLVSDWAMFMRAGADDQNLCDIVKPVLPHCDISELRNLLQLL
ncbi:uncharacterized protein LOC135386298 [Ornithodoros turicata]|uniref:uncharacterized protein LOC135386298 n=1 Tax=Ornithodoros turicata TaxID=34597 RepID=UPI0031394170